MKKIILVFALLLSLIAVAQNFPGEKVELLKDKTLKVLPKDEVLQEYGYDDFYTDAELKNIYKQQNFSTAYSALAGKEFKVLSYEPFREGFNNKYLRYKILLDNPETGKIYFKYDPEFTTGFPFEVIGGLDYPEGFFCEKIIADNTANYISYKTPIEEGVIITKTEADIFGWIINMPIPETYNPEKKFKGLTIVLSNNAKIALPAEVIRSALSPVGKTVLTASFLITQVKDLDLLEKYEIKSIKFDKYEQAIKSGRHFKEYVKCLRKK